MKIKDKYTSQVSKKQSPLQIQKQLILKALGTNDGTPSWKILIFDSYNQIIVSSQLKMKDLRDQNITIYLNLNQNREQIHGVTIEYLIQPTLQNIQIITNDLKDDMYSHVHIHFCSEPTPNILSTLARNLSNIKKNSVISRITKIEYSCIGYYPIDHSMCILPTEIQIINFLTVMMYQPIFIYNRANQPQKNLVQKLKSKLTSMSQTMVSQDTSKQTINNNNFVIFYIFNRETDNFPVLAHGITYASLLQNIYKINKIGNRVIKNNKQNNSMELSLQDEIWVQKKNYLISEMELLKQSNNIQSKMMVMGTSSEQYTEYNEKYKKIEWHLSNAQEMIRQGKKRRLNQFYQAQESIYINASLSKDTKKDILNLLKEGQNSQDKIRLLLIYILSCDNIDDVQQFQQIFPQITKNTKYNEFKIKKLKGSTGESAHNKYFKKLTKEIKSLIIADSKKFRVTKQLEKIKSADFQELVDSGLTVQSIISLPSNIKIQRNIVYCLGGACFHEYGNIIQFDGDVLYSGDQLISYRQLI